MSDQKEISKQMKYLTELIWDARTIMLHTTDTYNKDLYEPINIRENAFKWLKLFNKYVETK